MSDPLAVTARELISVAEQERDGALGQVRLLQGEVDSLKQIIVELKSELKPSGEASAQRSEFADRVVRYVWRTCWNAMHDDEPSTDIEMLKGWLEYRLEQWAAGRKTT